MSHLDRAITATMEQLAASPGDGRMYRVRPLGASAGGSFTGGPIARTDSTLFELAEEQVAMASAMQSASSGPFDALSALSFLHAAAANLSTSPPAPNSLSASPSQFAGLTWPSHSAPHPGARYSLASQGSGDAVTLMTLSNREAFLPQCSTVAPSVPAPLMRPSQR